MNVYEAAIGVPWAMTEEMILTVVSIAAREHEITPEALEAYRARSVQNAERLKSRDGVGIITARGPMFRYANLFAEISGATSYEVLRRDLQAAIDDPMIRAVVIAIDSPGGEANGIDELAKAVFEARETKPIAAYVGGNASSAAYWLAAAASEIVVSDAAVLGSIGVRMAFTDTSERDRRAGVSRIEFVSSQSPGKISVSDLQTDEGRARVQRTVDALGAVFIAALAKYRGVTAEDVLARFGGGGVEVGAEAVAAGMADRIGTFEGLLAELSRGRWSRPNIRPTKGLKMSETTITMEAHRQAVAEAEAKAEAKGGAAMQERMAAILDSEPAKGREALARHFAFKTTMPAKDAVAALEAAPKAAEPPKEPEKKPEEDKTAKDKDGKAYLDRKAADGALGLGGPDAAPPTTEAVGEIWKKVVARTNARLFPAAA